MSDLIEKVTAEILRSGNILRPSELAVTVAEVIRMAAPKAQMVGIREQAIEDVLSALMAHELYRYRPKAFKGFIQYARETLITDRNGVSQSGVSAVADGGLSVTAGETAPKAQLVGWTKVTADMPFEVLKSITIDNQVLAFERGRYFNAWLIFDEHEGGWCWVDENDSEPSPSHYRTLSEVALTTEVRP